MRKAGLAVAICMVASTVGGTAAAAAPTKKKEEAALYIVAAAPGKTAAPRGDLPTGALVKNLTVIGGYTAKLTPSEAKKLAASGAIVEKDAKFTIAGRDPLTPEEQEKGIKASATALSWGQDRIDQADLPLNGQMNLQWNGAGVRAYVVDTGIQPHTEFGSRRLSGYDAIGDGNGTNDPHGHGTHVAGTIASSKYGVAPGAYVVPVRVMGADGSGYWSDYIEGLNWIYTNGVRPGVVNASLGGGRYYAANLATTNVARKGFPFAVAAGNNAADACSTTPASASTVLTVGATDSADKDASFSNWGACLELYAPGVSITSTDARGSSGVTMSGTSMASPHVAGMAALYLQSNPTASTNRVNAEVLDRAVADRISFPYGQGDSPNVLANGQWQIYLPSLTAKVSGTKATLTWGSTPRVTSHRIYRGSTLVATVGASTRTYDVTVPTGVLTTLKVVPYGNGGAGGSRSLVVGPPASMTGLTATPSTTSVKLTWPAVDGRYQTPFYRVYLNNVYKASVQNPTATLTGLKRTTTYTVKVVPVNSLGTSGSKSVTFKTK